MAPDFRPLPFCRRLAVVLFTLSLLAALPGCSLFGWAAHAVAPDGQTVNVEAQYEDLVGHEVAVMVSAPDELLFEHPQAREAMSKLISQNLAENIEDIELMDPAQVIDYQIDNPYWHTLRYSRLIERLEVDRLVIVDLVDYRTHQPGNRHVHQGLATANVGVVEAEAADPDNYAFRTTVDAEYPEDTKIGAVNSDQETIQLGLLKRFADKAAGLFYDHKETR